MSATSPLARAVLESLDAAALDELARLLAPRLTGMLAPAEPAPSGWLDAKGAATYLGITTNALHKHTAARTIPFEQDCPGAKLWFRPAELDAWRRGEGSHHDVSASKTLPNATDLPFALRTRAKKNPA